MNKYEVYFPIQNTLIYVDEGEVLSTICEEVGYPLDLVCGGKGTCGKCKVKIKKENKNTEVLACQYKIKKNLEVYLEPSKIKNSVKILKNELEVEKYKGSIVKKNINLDPYSNESYGSILEKINNQKIHVSTEILKKISYFIENDIKEVSIILDKNNLLDIYKKDDSKKIYAAAVDIGTTTIVMYLFEITNISLQGVYSDTNGQTSIGADVISRIQYSIEKKDGLRLLNQKVIETINGLIEDADRELGEIRKNLYKLILCGNTTMQHLFLNLSPKLLGGYPFISITQDFVEGSNIDLNLNTNERGTYEFLPTLGGYIGADTISVLATIENDEKYRIIIDLGTNGELAIGNAEKYYVASTACGPALEGAGIEFGMRGEAGAIEKFRIKDEKIELQVIENIEPTGICGSGIIDIIAELIINNFIDNSGKLLEKEEYINKYGYNKLTENLIICENNKSFLIADNNNKKILVTQKDIRQVQLAKSAISTGCNILICKYKINKESIDEMILSGAFGNYINIKNAKIIGLIPDIDNIIVKSIGNGAGLGVQKYLMDKSIYYYLQKIKKNTKHIELTTTSEFQKEYIKNLDF